MATIHTARNIVGNDKPTPLFSLQGLHNQAPATIQSLNIQGIALEKQIAYSHYSSNVSAFLYATAEQRITTISPLPYGLIDPITEFILTPPTVSFSLAKEISNDQQDKLLQNLGPDASKTKQGRLTVFHAPKLPMARLLNIDTAAVPHHNAGRDAVNPKGMLAFQFLNTVATLFLRVHAYPAFRDEDEDSMTMFDQIVSSEFGGSYYSREYSVKEGEETVTKIRDLDMHSRTINEHNKRPADEDAEDERPAKSTKTAKGYLRFTGKETVSYARPAKNVGSNIGTVADIPSSPGLLFPYFHGLIQPDAPFLSSIALRLFYQLMGRTHTEAQSNYINIRHGIGSLASTAQGMQFAHIFLGIDLALSTQGRCFLIISNDKYQGFTLLGARLAVFANSRWFHSASVEEYQKALNRMDPHDAAVDDIIERLKKLKESDQYTGLTVRSVFEEPGTLAEELGKLKLAAIPDEDIRELDKLVRSLNYMGAGYLAQNPQIIGQMLNTLASGKPVALERPAYLPSVRTDFTSRAFRLLCRFGPEAPSFWNDRGDEIVCKPVEKTVLAANGTKKKVGEEDVFGMMPIKVLITPKPLTVAVKDMEKVMSVGKVKMDVKERAGKHRAISLEHEETRKNVWKELVALCASVKPKDAKEPSKLSVAAGPNVDDALMDLLS